MFSLRGCEAEALQRTLDRAGLLPALPADYASAYAQISSSYWRARAADDDTHRTREGVLYSSWRDFLSRYSLDTANASELAQHFWSAFCSATALNPGAEDVLKRLATGNRLGVISNGYSDSQRGRLDAAGLTHRFEVIVISEEAGVAKPDRRIFDLTLAQLQLSAADVLYIGDSISHDLAGCLAAGIDFCYYSPVPTADRKDAPASAFRINHLSDLIAILPSR